METLSMSDETFGSAVVDAAVEAPTVDSAVETPSIETTTDSAVETDVQSDEQSGADDEGADEIDPKTGEARTEEQIKALREERAASRASTTDKAGDPLPKEVTKAIQAFKNADPANNAKMAKEM